MTRSHTRCFSSSSVRTSFTMRSLKLSSLTMGTRVSHMSELVRAISKRSVILIPKRSKSWEAGPVERMYDQLKGDWPWRGGGKGVDSASAAKDAAGVLVGTAWPGVQPEEKYCAQEGATRARAARASVSGLIVMVGGQIGQTSMNLARTLCFESRPNFHRITITRRLGLIGRSLGS